jgi:hypothetical protein
LQFHQWINSLHTHFFTTQVNECINDLGEQARVNINLVPNSLLGNLGQYCLDQLVDHPVNDDRLELLHALVIQIGNIVHFDIESVQVLKEIFQPPDHDLVILPSQHYLVQQSWLV